MGFSFEAYQSLGGTVEGVAMVTAELRVGALERRVTGSLGLLDALEMSVKLDRSLGITAGTHPLRCALRCWLCCEEFFDSVQYRISLVYPPNFMVSMVFTYWPWRRYAVVCVELPTKFRLHEMRDRLSKLCVARSTPLALAAPSHLAGIR